MEKKALKQGILGSIKLKFYAELIGRFLSSSQNGYQMSEGNENFTLQGNGVYLLTEMGFKNPVFMRVTSKIV